MRIKIFAVALIEVLLVWCVSASSHARIPEFLDYPAVVYTKRLHIPSYYVKVGDIWRDDMGKEVAAPHINFAGKYYLGLHSCGTGCRYYTLSNLENGKDSHALSIFSSKSERPTRTIDGRIYLTELISRSESKLLVAKYHIEGKKENGLPNTCRQRIFVLSDDGEKIYPVTDTIKSCHTL